MDRSLDSRIVCCCAALLLLAVIASPAHAQQITYEYDALGRLCNRDVGSRLFPRRRWEKEARRTASSFTPRPRCSKIEA